MTPKEVIENTIATSHMILTTYLSDLGNADLLVRSVPGANHIAWQLGHLVSSEHQMMTEAGFDMPALPDRFAESHTKETAASDDPAQFHGKDEYLSALEAQRGATLSALEGLPEDALDQAGPEAMRDYAPTIAALFNMIGVHELMHAGQFVAVRRKLGKPITI